LRQAATTALRDEPPSCVKPPPGAHHDEIARDVNTDRV
jgi:hypothetical protein